MFSLIFVDTTTVPRSAELLCLRNALAGQTPMTVSRHNNSSPCTPLQLAPPNRNVRLQGFHPEWSLEWAGGSICKICVSGRSPLLLALPPSIFVPLLQFPDVKYEYCVRRRGATPVRMDSDLPYCSSTEADLRRMKRELYSPVDSNGLNPMERKMLLPPQRSFSPDVQQICYPQARRDILSIEREIDERSWAAFDGRMRSPPEFPTFSIPRFENGRFVRIKIICNSGQIGI